MRRVVGLLAIAAAACGKSASKSSPAEPPPSESTASSAIAPSAKLAPTVVTLAIGGDLLPHTNVLKNKVTDVFAGAPSAWAEATLRIANLEAPVGDEAKADRIHLVYTSPPRWFDELVTGAKVDAFAAANNHACDVGLSGLVDTVHAAAARSVPVAGITSSDPWTPAKIPTAAGRTVCLVSWTSVLNETVGPRFDACAKGNPEARLAFAPANEQGVARVHEALSAKGRWDGCDARVAFFHGGVEYHAQPKTIVAMAEAAAAYVDVVAIAHPHVPDGASLVSAPAAKDGADVGDRAAGRRVPVFRSLGNLLTNQGYAWSLGGPTGVVTSDDGGVDMLRTVWTRIAMIARVELTWEAGAPSGAAPRVRYGYALAYTEHTGAGLATLRLRALGATADDPIASALEHAPIPWSWLIQDRCRVTESTTPWCEATP